MSWESERGPGDIPSSPLGSWPDLLESRQFCRFLRIPALQSPTSISALFSGRRFLGLVWKRDAHELPFPSPLPCQHPLVALSGFHSGVRLLGGHSCSLSGSRNEGEHLLRAHDLLYVTEPSQPLSRETIIRVLLMRCWDAEPVAWDPPPLPAQGQPWWDDELSGEQRWQRQPGWGSRLSRRVLLFPDRCPSLPSGSGTWEAVSLAEKQREQHPCPRLPCHQTSPGGTWWRANPSFFTLGSLLRSLVLSSSQEILKSFEWNGKHSALSLGTRGSPAGPSRSHWATFQGHGSRWAFTLWCGLESPHSQGGTCSGPGLRLAQTSLHLEPWGRTEEQKHPVENELLRDTHHPSYAFLSLSISPPEAAGVSSSLSAVTLGALELWACRPCFWTHSNPSSPLYKLGTPRGRAGIWGSRTRIRAAGERGGVCAACHRNPKLW